MMCVKSWQTPARVFKASSMGESTCVDSGLYSKFLWRVVVRSRSTVSGSSRRSRRIAPANSRRAGVSCANRLGISQSSQRPSPASVSTSSHDDSGSLSGSAAQGTSSTAASAVMSSRL